jgi:LysR family transcriptional activator of nhaA
MGRTASFVLLNGIAMAALNYHHLRYFWIIAHSPSLSSAAERLHVSQSALSIQLRQLEQRLGHALFERTARKLVLTEAGRLALEYADTIFRNGEELLSTLQGQRPSGRMILRIGAVSTLSRNFQLEFLRPVLGRDDVELVIRSGSLRELLAQLAAHTLDLVLTNVPVPRDSATPWHVELLEEHPVSLVGKPGPRGRRFRFPDDLRHVPVVLPSLQSSLRGAFDQLLSDAGVQPIVAAEIDDMAMLRLMARESDGVTLVPRVVVQDELSRKVLVEKARIPALRETFYAVRPNRSFPNPLVRRLVRGRE